MSAETPTTLNMDIRDLQIQTVTVEKLLEPLIIQVTTLVNCPQNPSNRKKGRSKRAKVLLASVEEATRNLLDKGEKMAKEAAVLKEELTAALQEVRKEGNALKVSAERFTDDPCYLPKREAVVQAARALLAAVTRLLILADMIDVMCLLQHVSSFQRTFESLRNVSNKSDLQKTYQKLGKELETLDYLAFKRQQDLKSPSQRDEIAGARATLKENSPLLHSICSACLEHSDVASLKASKDTVCEEIQNALDVISNASQGIQNVPALSEPQAATLGSALDELENLIVLNPLTVTEEEIRPSLEKRLEAIISGAALLADSSCTRDFHRERIIAECNAIRQALQDLLSEYMSNTGKAEKSNTLNAAIDNMSKKTRDLRRQLRKAIIDHVSDSFLDTTVPLLVLIEAAKNGREKEIKEYAAIFHEHTGRLVEVANLACSMSTNEDGIKIVRIAANHLETLCPQIINAALALASRPKSQVVKNTMDMYKRTWEHYIHVLTEAVDDITSIDDFLAVSESHILEDVNKCIIALRDQDVDNLDRAAGAIRGRAARVAHIVTGEMDSYEPGAYTDGVMKNVNFLTGTVIPEFVTQVNVALDALSKNSLTVLDDNQFVDISKKIYDTIHDIRCSVMMIRTPEELEDVSDLEEDHEVRSHASIQTEGKTDRSKRKATDKSIHHLHLWGHQAKMTQLPEAEKEKIAEQVADFKKVKSKLDAEIEIWDDTSNDIIVLAKKMCMIMMEMTDFTRGKGPLKHTTDVIYAAKMISESGSRMDVLARQIANQCPDPPCKQDLLAYLEQIKFYSHQLKICSQVKAEIQNLGGELIMSALDSVTSLIQAAKNLMNAVVQTVKMSYIASTKIIRVQSSAGPRHPVVMWRMKAPAKKPLIKREKPEETCAAVRRGSAKKKIHPVQVMSEFRGRQVY
ncbi:catenin alpha-3 isoform X1 [Peromyscus maniculatus bairdii]|uniref:catenin alpha-3 isoform X1 n=1 Tax=Peromyscus maniculatus bairdii TaxID=230844 RepID=UPI001C2EE0BF|nr:catenin alpha-3 isoform X1 [Peromyscus maniculatus bairdii]XP_042122627.1 catenin alpha-3 isoform X1 [Peromyscus maniculatus bairdii]XP_042122628.1 catenin alpha-3 isoform X1 [Peromyscus maniculatus bairdii]